MGKEECDKCPDNLIPAPFNPTNTIIYSGIAEEGLRKGDYLTIDASGKCIRYTPDKYPGYVPLAAMKDAKIGQDVIAY